MSLLSHEEILSLHGAAIAAQLLDLRAALLTGIDAAFVATLAPAEAPGAQVLRDLDAMNGAETLLDGSAPLATWLTNAVALAGPRQEAQLFEATLRQVRRRRAALGGATAAAVSPPREAAPSGRAPGPPEGGLFVTRIIASDDVYTVWIAARGPDQYVLDSLRIRDVPVGGLGPTMSTAVLRDARYRFTYEEGAEDDERPLNPPLSLGPETRQEASFTLAVALQGAYYYTRLPPILTLGYHTHEGRRGSLLLLEPPSPGKVLARLLGRDVLAGAPYKRESHRFTWSDPCIEQIVTPSGTQRGREEEEALPVLQLVPVILPGSGALWSSPESLAAARARCSDALRRRGALHEELRAKDLVGELARLFESGQDWIADLLGSLAEPAALAALESRLERDPADRAAVHGLCVRHLVTGDDRLAARVLSSPRPATRYDNPFEEAASALTMAPRGGWIEALRPFVSSDEKAQLGVLSALRDELSAEEQDRWCELFPFLREPTATGLSLARLAGEEVLAAEPLQGVWGSMDAHFTWTEPCIEQVVTPAGTTRAFDKASRPALRFSPVLLPPPSVAWRGPLALAAARAGYLTALGKRDFLHRKLREKDATGELLRLFGEGQDWVADLLGSMGDPDGWAALESRLEEDPLDRTALHGWAVRHLVTGDGRLAAHVRSCRPSLGYSGDPLNEALVALSMVPGGDGIEALRHVLSSQEATARQLVGTLGAEMRPEDRRRMCEGFLGADLFVRGTMNHWASPPPLRARLDMDWARYSGDRSQCTLRLAPGRYCFKVADAAWTPSSNWGAPEPGCRVVLGEPLPLVSHAQTSNVELDLEGMPERDYRFVVDARYRGHLNVTVFPSSDD